MEFNSRMDLPRIFTERGYKVGAEVGVYKGAFAAHILQNWSGFMFLIDPWSGSDGSVNTINAIMAILRATNDRRQWSCFRQTSLEVASNRFIDLLDFVYIDADHSYEAVKSDIEAWWKHLKPGGILAGHDWVLDGWHIDGQPFIAHETRPQEHGCHEYGVRRAVAELQEPGGILHGLEMHVTPPEADDGWQSFLFIKPEEK